MYDLFCSSVMADFATKVENENPKPDEEGEDDDNSPAVVGITKLAGLEIFRNCCSLTYSKKSLRQLSCLW